jgi:hypothetical protein
LEAAARLPQANASDARAERAARRADALVAFALGACALALYAISFQHSYWSDGRLLMTWVEARITHHYHAAYLPLAHLFQYVLGPFYDGDPERPLLWLSASSTALAVGWTFLAARACGAGRSAAALGAGALATAPSVWFYATCVELHGPHLAVAAIVTTWLARAYASGRWGRGAVAPALAFLALYATHVGAALWLPALALVALRGGERWSWPRGAWLALLLGGAALVAWIAFTRELPSSRRFAAEAAVGALLDWKPATLWTEFVLPASLLALIGLPGLLLCAPARADRRLTWRACAACAVLPYLFVVPGFAYAERGAYFAGVWPLLACGVALALEYATRPFTEPAARAAVFARPFPRWGAFTLLLGATAVVAQARYSVRYVADWEHAYRGHEWVEPLRLESGNRGFVLVLESWEREAVRKHTRLDAIALRDEGLVARANGLDARSVAWMLGRALDEGGIAAVSTSVIDSPEGRGLVPQLEPLLGALVAGRDLAYRVCQQPLPPVPPRAQPQ